MASERLIIRRASPGDVDTLADFQCAMAKETEGKVLAPQTVRHGVRAIFASPEKGFYVVAESGKRVVGMLLMTYEWSDWRNGAYWWVQSVYVEPGWRRKGVYRALYTDVYESARNSREVCGIRLYVARDNRVAKRVYSGLGMIKSQYDMYEVEFSRPDDPTRAES